jgi:nucleoside-diphosphate kinase
MVEKTLLLIKHDGVARGLIGKIVERLEQAGFKISGLKMVWADDHLAENHYPLEEEWAKKLFERTKKTKEEKGESFEYKDHMEFGSKIMNMNKAFLKEGPVVAIVAQGPAAIEITRKMLGHTEPRQALPGTIRGDFASVESYKLADDKQRSLRNLVHGSDSTENAEREIALWFSKEELHDYSKDLDKHL